MMASLARWRGIAQIRAVVAEVGSERLAPIKERLPETISYGEIRCVVAGRETMDQ